MDLALNLGVSVQGLSHSMTEGEFRLWIDYAGKKMLPWQRIEWHLAQITRWIAMTMGGVENAQIWDYLIEPRVPVAEDEEMDDDETLEMAKKAFGFKPVNVKE